MFLYGKLNAIICYHLPALHDTVPPQGQMQPSALFQLSQALFPSLQPEKTQQVIYFPSFSRGHCVSPLVIRCFSASSCSVS
jgi:hypothetical protein